jgi:hypothetical protein
VNDVRHSWNIATHLGKRNLVSEIDNVDKTFPSAPNASTPYFALPGSGHLQIGCCFHVLLLATDQQ